MQLDGKRIIVTGGARGMGEATVRTFAAQGATVVSLDLNDDAGHRIAEEAGPNVTYQHCDVSDKAAVDAVFGKAIDTMGGVDALAHLAGIEEQVDSADVTEASLDKMFAVNVKGTVFTNQAVLAAMRDNGGGSIINYASAAGVIGVAGMPAYSIAKAGVLGWTRVAAQEWGRHLVRVNAVCPSALTPLAEQWLNEMEPDKRAMWDEHIRVMTPLGGRLGTMDEIADVNVFLASDLSRFMTGQTISVDGGQVMVR